jgi:NAD(P)-dependent dehydrogenase (short-subunit alcohol dehydrogenase family)
LTLIQFLAREWATRGDRVNSLTPGFFPAEQNRALLFNADGSTTARTQAHLGPHPMNRFGESPELVGAVVFLASQKAASFVTGIDLRLQNGCAGDYPAISEHVHHACVPIGDHAGQG